jgi:hypothetical protein
MKSAEILEWVMGWPWPVLFVFVVLMAGGIFRMISWDKQDLPEEQLFGSIPSKECVCQCE